MARNNRKTFRILLIFALCFVKSGFLWAQKGPILHDNADLLTEEQKLALINDMQPILEYGGAAFVTNEAEYEGEASDLCKNLCYQFFDGESGTVFLIDMYNRRIEIYSTGRLYKIITKSRANAITDNVYTHASREEYYECAQKVFQQMLIAAEGKRLSVPMRYVSNLLVAACLVFGIMFLFLYIGRVNMNITQRKKLVSDNDDSIDDIDDDNEENLKKNNHSNVIINEKTLVKETKKIHYESTSSGSSGGYSSGGGYSGGGGGGGGHSF